MSVGETILKIQDLLLIPKDKQAPVIGPLTRAAFTRLSQAKAGDPWGKGDDDSLGHPGEGARDINDRAVALIQHFEGLHRIRSDGKIEAYLDVAGVWTIGFGHTGLQHKDGTVYPGRVITEAKADQLFRYDMEQFEARVSAFVKVPLNDDEYGALVAFDFNTGGLKNSTLLRKLNAGDRAGAANEFLKWDKATVNGRKVPIRGLTRRRHSERRLFLSQEPFILSLAQLDRIFAGQPV